MRFVRKALADVDPNLTILNMVSFGEQVARNFNQERLVARLADLFGVLALILACHSDADLVRSLRDGIRCYAVQSEAHSALTVGTSSA